MRALLAVTTLVSSSEFWCGRPPAKRNGDVDRLHHQLLRFPVHTGPWVDEDLVTWKAELKKIGEQTRLALRVNLRGLNIGNITSSRRFWGGTSRNHEF